MKITPQHTLCNLHNIGALFANSSHSGCPEVARQGISPGAPLPESRHPPEIEGGGGLAPGGIRRRGGAQEFAVYIPEMRAICAGGGGKRNTPGANSRAAPGGVRCENAKACAQLNRRLGDFRENARQPSLGAGRPPGFGKDGIQGRHMSTQSGGPAADVSGRVTGTSGQPLCEPFANRAPML